MMWPANSEQLSVWLNKGHVTICFTGKSRLIESKIANVEVVFVCDFGLCIVWGNTERFVPWYHIDHIERPIEKG